MPEIITIASEDIILSIVMMGYTSYIGADNMSIFMSGVFGFFVIPYIPKMDIVIRTNGGNFIYQIVEYICVLSTGFELFRRCFP